MSDRPSLVKQIAGAVIGGSLGLLLYGGYQVASPTLSAWLTIPQQHLESNGVGSRIADNNRNERETAHFESRAREIAKEFGAAYKNYQVKESAPEAEASSSTASIAAEASSTGVIPFEGATTESDAASSASSSAESSASEGSDRTKAVRELWNDDAIAKAPGPDTDELPDSGIGVLTALIAAGAGAGGLRVRRRK